MKVKDRGGAVGRRMGSFSSPSPSSSSAGRARGGRQEDGGGQKKKKRQTTSSDDAGVMKKKTSGESGRVGAKRRKVVKNALRSAQLDKSQLLMWRKFGYGERLFSHYYRKQRVMADDELSVVQATFATPLPVTFRLHATDPRAAAFAARLDELAKGHGRTKGRPLVKPLAWMPEGEGWQALPAAEEETAAGPGDRGVGGGGRGRRRDTLPEEVAEVIREGTSAGLIARQEAVSMLPVLILAPAVPLTAGSRVLDVCAAPGNKSMQLLERCAPPAASGEVGRTPARARAGLVVANDAHPGRVKTLQEAIVRHRRAVRESQALVITCAMGQNIPTPAFVEEATGEDEASRVVRAYDAVLADVPCSGDGTLRKDPDVLRRWHPGVGNCLHATQLAVARRAAALVRPGGALLYSTCTLNPVEDEAVVAAILTGPGGDQWELDADAVKRGAPGMKYRPGVSTWGVAEHVLKGSRGSAGADVESDSDSDDEVSLRWYDTYEQAVAAGMPAAAPTMWPPATQKEAKKLHLERCARFLPHDQDTGGFFVALLRRREAPPSPPQRCPSKKEDAEEKRKAATAAAAARAEADLSDPVRPLPPGEASAVATHLGLHSRTGRRLWLGARGTVTLVPRSARGGDGLSELGAIAVASAGVVALKTRVLTHGEDTGAAGGFPYDFTQAGAEAMAPLMRKRRVQAVPTDLQVMLAARASGVDTEVAGNDEVLCLTPDEMSDTMVRRWEQSERGAVVFVLLRRTPPSSSDDKAPPPPSQTVFVVAGRCTDDGFMLSPEVSVDESRWLLAQLSEVAGKKNRGNAASQKGARRVGEKETGKKRKTQEAVRS